MNRQSRQMQRADEIKEVKLEAGSKTTTVGIHHEQMMDESRKTNEWIVKHTNQQHRGN